jgi:hypothetical protein
MPMHDWTRVDAGVFHAFHHEWISEISRYLNRTLPKDYYALPEQVAAGFGPDILTLQEHRRQTAEPSGGTIAAPAPVQARPQARFIAESSAEFYRRRKSSVAVRHVSGDRIVAVVEIVSPGNKAGRAALRAFVDKACEFLEHRIHLLIIDPFPPTARDPEGIHGAIWEEVHTEPFVLPLDKRLTLAAYECDVCTRAYVNTVAVGEALPDMPLYLEASDYLTIPLERTYETAFAVMPARWQSVLEA